MKKAEVKIGGHYIANVSGRRTVVRIIEPRSTMKNGSFWSLTGWNAVNLLTGRNIVIGNAMRLQREVPADRLQRMLEIYTK